MTTDQIIRQLREPIVDPILRAERDFIIAKLEAAEALSKVCIKHDTKIRVLWILDVVRANEVYRRAGL